MSNTQDEARLDISAVGVYAPFEKTFMDVRVTHPNCKTNVFKPLARGGGTSSNLGGPLLRNTII